MVTASRRTASGATLSASTAMRMAWRLARRMSRLSMSRALPTPTPIAIATLRTRTSRCSRVSASRRLESSRPGSRQRSGRITAAATTGPAREPRPASSTPAIDRYPRRRSSCSSRSSSARRPNSAKSAGSGSGRTRGGGSYLFGALLVDAGRLSLAAAQVVELRAAHRALPLHLDSVDDRRVQRKNTLDSDPARDLANGEGFPCAAAAPGDDHTRENLDAFLLSLTNLDMHAH